jgi:hypothetical protein
MDNKNPKGMKKKIGGKRLSKFSKKKTEHSRKVKICMGRKAFRYINNYYLKGEEFQ